MHAVHAHTAFGGLCQRLSGMGFAASDSFKNCNIQYLTLPTRLLVTKCWSDRYINVSGLPTRLLIRLDLWMVRYMYLPCLWLHPCLLLEEKTLMNKQAYTDINQSIILKSVRDLAQIHQTVLFGTRMRHRECTNVISYTYERPSSTHKP